MGGGGRLVWIFILLLLVGAAYVADDSTGSVPLPKAEPRPVQEDFHGMKVVDKYRWLEDGNNPETQKWVAEEMSYTRGALDPLPGREASQQRLTQLLSMGRHGGAEVCGGYYVYTARWGVQRTRRADV